MQKSALLSDILISLCRQAI